MATERANDSQTQRRPQSSHFAYEFQHASTNLIRVQHRTELEMEDRFRHLEATIEQTRTLCRQSGIRIEGQE